MQECVQSIRRRFEDSAVEVTVADKEDLDMPNHLSGKLRRWVVPGDCLGATHWSLLCRRSACRLFLCLAFRGDQPLLCVVSSWLGSSYAVCYIAACVRYLSNISAGSE